MKFLIIKTSSLGDILHVFPVLHYLREKFPQATIDWVVEAPFVSLLEAHPAVSNVIPVHTRTWKRTLSSYRTWKEIFAWRNRLRSKAYDVVFDLQGNCKSALITHSAKAPNKIGFGFKTAPEWPSILAATQRFNPPLGKNIRDDYLYIVQSFFEDKVSLEEKEVVLNITAIEEKKLDALIDTNSSQFHILVCPGAAWTNKQAPLKPLLKKLEAKYQARFLFLWGNADERLLAQELSLHVTHGEVLEKLSLPLLQNLMRRVDLVVAMDSLPLHLCGTTMTPTLSIFGPSSATKYRPKGAQHRSIEGTCPYGITFEKRCPHLRTCKTGKCSKEISLEGIEI